MKKIIIVLFLFSISCFAKDLYHNKNLIYFWNFDNERRFLIDVKSNTIAHKRGTVRWIPREYSYNNSPVIHIHGNIDPNSSFTIPARYLERELNEWTLDFEFGAGSHDLDHTNRDNGELMPFGQILRWGDLRITFYQDSAQGWKGIVRIIYQGQKRTIEYLRGFKYYYMAVRSEENGISIWLDSYCTDYIEIPRTSVVGLPIVFGGNGFAGRFDDIKVYNERLKPWEITSNYWGKELNIESKDKLIFLWSKIKKQGDL
tara:strand:- start:1955 stop:2728 length:774 start_codon:yes stop_codon:yes gene_type:complete